DGGDELFGGYQHYDRLLKLAAVGKCIPRAVRRGVGAAALRSLPPGHRGRNWAAAIATDCTKGVPQIASYVDRRTRVALVPALHNLEWSAEDVWATSVYPNGDLIDRATRTDFSNYLPEDILVKV